MNKQPSRIGLYLVLIIALVAGYFYLNNQVVSQSNYTQKQLEQALEDNKVVDATIQQNREVPTGSVIVDTTDSGQKKVYVTDVNQAIELLNKYDIDITALFPAPPTPITMILADDSASFDIISNNVLPPLFIPDILFSDLYQSYI